METITKNTCLPISLEKLLEAIREHLELAADDHDCTHALTIHPSGKVEHRRFIGSPSYSPDEYYGRVPHELTIMMTDAGWMDEEDIDEEMDRCSSDEEIQRLIFRLVAAFGVDHADD